MQLEEHQEMQDLTRIISYHSIREIRSALKEKGVSTDDLSRLETIQKFIIYLPEDERKRYLNLYQYILRPLSLRLVKYKKSEESPLTVTDLGGWSLVTDVPIFVNNKYIYKMEKIGQKKMLKSGWNYQEIEMKETLLVIDRYTEGVLEIRGPVKSMKRLCDQLAHSFKWEDYAVINFDNEDMKSILNQMNAMVNEIKLELEAGDSLTSVQLANRGGVTNKGIPLDADMQVLIKNDETDDEIINLSEAVSSNMWFENEEYKGYLSKDGTFMTRALLTEAHIEYIINVILEVKFKSIVDLQRQQVPEKRQDLKEAFAAFYKNTTYNSLARFSASYFAKRTNIDQKAALKYLLELSNYGLLEKWYEVSCNNPQCGRIAYSSKSLEEVDQFLQECPYCGNDKIFNDENRKFYFRVSGAYNIPQANPLNEKTKEPEDMQSNMQDIYELIESARAECSKAFRDKDYKKISEEIEFLEGLEFIKAQHIAEELREEYQQVLKR